MVAASPIRHEPQSSLAPVAVHQYQLFSWPNFLTGNAAVGDPSTASLPSGCAQYRPGFHEHGSPQSSSHQLQLQQLHDFIELQQPPPFQQLLNSFGNLSSLTNDDEDDDDDGVVSLPEDTGSSRRRSASGGGSRGLQYVIGGGGGEKRQKGAMIGGMDM